MSQEQKKRPPMTEEERQRRIERLRRERRRKRRQQALIMRAAVLGVLILILIGSIALVSAQVRRSKAKKAEEKAKQEKLIQEEEAKNKQRKESIDQAEVMAQGYDYDGAIELLKSLDNYDKDADIVAKIAGYEADKSTLVAVNMNEITHIFYHSLVVDPERGFAGNDRAAAGFKQWMTTVDEFNKITQAMYDNGYVLIDLHDMVTETTDENGTVHFTTNQIMLPEGKKPFVLSLDDLSYYHSYDGRGVASKIVLDENGKPTCEYIQADGTTVTGAYDCIPLLDQFLEEHPDGAYHGARGTIALTGYNGILGYRTDIAYKTRENLTADQQAWLDANPDFDYDKECEEAKKVTEKLNPERKENSQKIEIVEKECIQQINTYKKDVLEKENRIKSLSVEIQSKENIINELNGEKIDVIEWNEDPAIYISSALLPAQVMAVDIKDEEHFAQVIVPDDQLSLAIGKAGQNARLAAKLTNWKIDIKSESQFREMIMNMQNEEAKTEEKEETQEVEE